MAMLQACWEHGLRYFDTAPLYGESEAMLGRFLADAPRAGEVVSTKVGRLPAPAGERRFAFDRDEVLRSVERSLACLRRDRIDIVAVHDLAPAMLGDGYDPAVRDLLDGGYQALAELKASGAVGALAVATYDPAAAVRLLRAAPFDSVMIVGAMTLLSQEAEAELLPFCTDKGIGVVLASPFHTGLLVTGVAPGAKFNMRDATAAEITRTQALQRVCDRHGVPLAAAAIQFPLRAPTIASVVTGHRTPDEVAINLAWLRQPAPDAFWNELQETGLVGGPPQTVPPIGDR